MTRSRYFKEAVKHKAEFSWTSDPVMPSKGRPDLIHFSSFRLNQMNIRTGDHVLVRATDTMDSELECDVARVESLYDNPANKTDPHRAIISWLCRPCFLPTQLDNSHGMEEDGVPPLDNLHEVVGEAREFGVDISAETIYMKCLVVEGEISQRPAEFIKDHKQGSMYCYMHRFNLKNLKRKKFSLEPCVNLSQMKSKVPTKPNLVADSPKVTPLKVKLTNLRVSKRKLSGGDEIFCVVNKDKSANKKSEDSSNESSPELNSFVTGVIETTEVRAKRVRRSTQGQSKETPKPAEDKAGGKRRHKSTSSIISGERFTQVQTATGSGRKLTIKCGDKSKLKSKEIIHLLTDDDETEEIVDIKRLEKKESKAPVAPKRSRRASVSCTTPAKEKSGRRQISKRPTSEVKKKRKELSDEDDDFVPIKKKYSKPGRKVSKPATSWSETESSSSESDSDSDSSLPLKKPTHASARKTQTGKTPNKKTFKPSVAPRAKPLPANVDPITEAQRRLHVSAVPSSLPCREEEFAEIFGYVEAKLREGTGGCCYISGVPGTGKTATVMEVIRYLQDNKEDYPDFNFYAMNGMRLTSPEQAYVEMWQQLSGSKATAEHAMKLLNTRFTTASPKRIPSVFLVDELDMLCNRKQSVLYNIFDWPSKPESKLIVIAIANTMDLPERVMINRVSSRLGLTRQVFQPYTHTQLQTIVSSRLEGLSIFQQDAIQLVARKVASLSGDARRALDICRRATEMAEAGGRERIKLEDVTRAHQEMFSSPKILAIRSSSPYEQILLRVLVSEFHRTGVEESQVRAVYREMSTCLRTEGRECLSLPGLVALLARLSAARLILAEHFKLGLETKLRLNVSTEEINFALKSQDDD